MDYKGHDINWSHYKTPRTIDGFYAEKDYLLGDKLTWIMALILLVLLFGGVL